MRHDWNLELVYVETVSPRDPLQNGDCRVILDDPRLNRVANELRPFLRNGIRIIAGADANDAPLGTSRLGGEPDLPDGVNWPTVKIEMPQPSEGFLKSNPYVNRLPSDGIVPLPFVAQINLEETHPFDIDGVLPPSGMLYFFFNPKGYESDTGTPQGATGYISLTYGWDNPGNWRVIFNEDDKALVRQKAPENVPNDVRYRARAVSFRSEQVLPSFDTCYFGKSSEVVKRVTFTDTESEAFGELRDELRANIDLHQMLGYADEYSTASSEGSYQYWRSLLFPELPAKASIGESAWVAELHAIRLLLQLEVFDEDGDRFGRAGRLLFFIRESDLKVRNIEGAWAIGE